MTRPPSGDPPPWGRTPEPQPQPTTPYAQPQYGPPQYGPPQYGPPQYGPPQYGPPHYGPPHYGQPQYGQPPYGYGGPPYGPYGPYAGGRPPGRRKLVIGLVIGGLALLAVVVAVFVAVARTTPDSTVPAPAATREPTGLGNDPVFDQLARACHDGDMSSCDDLYDRSDIDSAYEEYGDTCAGRRGGGAWAYCVDVYSDTD
ncbi:hypothetical protein [Modestobacter excelsi]|uniref:hypothetical protein n=1 Tax=Modestobacter excelsi TaxID=2213161 RepID=UPI00110CAFD4|nr:hypothetical protein [Modestobacter excelsi]